ncbi:MAG: ATP synthase subunit alpha [Patescibacteria group bacterium]|nr:MAG: ATP synthase subunit alpha [Patescibacteria group bacterium]
MTKIDTVVKEIIRELQEVKPNQKAEIGEVVEIKDGVVAAAGLKKATYGEVVEFENGEKGYIIDLTEDTVGIVVLDEYENIQAGDSVKALGYQLSVPVSDEIIGRVVNPLGKTLDSDRQYKAEANYPVEKIAPGVIYRKPVSEPLQTGINAIDALIPIGRGQRELIIGDRNTGKTTIAIDTIINQKGKDIVCIYCSIGQRRSKTAITIETLREKGAMDYTIVVTADSSDPATLQYIAPYSATAIAEYFMDKGKDVLVVYDDLSKHAWAYREISLILRRPAGREAYPGDVFYLHSRLLERACRIDDKYGGGSITALPIIETLEGDVSAYIPTNVISITDGQIYLEKDLFNNGIRPAINVGTSVSRVGSAAQTKAIKKVAGRLKLDLAQYREMAAFSQFESELDEATRNFLNRGAKITNVLIQKKGEPYDLAEQVIVIWAGIKGYLDNVPLSEISQVKEKILQTLNLSYKKLADKINQEKDFTDDDEKIFEKIVTTIVENYQSDNNQ